MSCLLLNLNTLSNGGPPPPFWREVCLKESEEFILFSTQLPIPNKAVSTVMLMFGHWNIFPQIYTHCLWNWNYAD